MITGSGIQYDWERLGAVAEERRDRDRRGWAGATEHYRRAAMRLGASAGSEEWPDVTDR